jgi:major capsid protein E
MDLYATTTLVATLAELDTPASFLLDSFFPATIEAQTEELAFDIMVGKPRIAPFVSPLVEGKVMGEGGYRTKLFRPAYVKDKRRLDPHTPLRRWAGTTIGGAVDPMRRRVLQIGASQQDQLNNLTRREEVMAAEAMITGKITVTGERYPTVVVDFERDPANTVTLTGANRWGQAGISPAADLETWADQVHSSAGATATRVIMEPKAYRLFAADPKIEKFLDRQAYRAQQLFADAPLLARQGNGKAVFRGFYGAFEIWTYQDAYIDDDSNPQKVMPDHQVIMGSPDQTEGARCYGAIQDEENGYRATRYFPKSWLTPDPAVRWLLLQSAPLPVPFRINATMSIKVA